MLKNFQVFLKAKQKLAGNLDQICHLFQFQDVKTGKVIQIFILYLLKTYNYLFFHVNLVFYITENHYKYKLLNK